MKKVFYFFFLFVVGMHLKVFSQQDPDGYTVFYHENGNIASEGTLRQGKPDGYWKTYYENGILKSEGNRVNFLLDSTWCFYDEGGKILLKIDYKKNRKNGMRTTFREEEYMEESFLNDVKEGYTNVYFSDGSLKSSTLFVKGLEQGLSKTYNRDSVVIRMVQYKNGFVVSRDEVNRKDRKGYRQGRWVLFWDNGKIYVDGFYRDDRKHGYFKTYDRFGELVKVEKYDNGELHKNAREVAEIELKRSYYPDGKIKVVAGFRNGKMEGIKREYDERGKVISAEVYEEGVLLSEGIIEDDLSREGYWKDYYPSGALRAEGNYKADNRSGVWKFYYADGSLQQKGSYNEKGNYDGEWKWFFPSGKLLRVESFINGREDGLMQEFDEDGEVIVSGSYVDGLEEGAWIYTAGDVVQKGNYRGGLRNGLWKTVAKDGTLLFKGEFIDDNPNGRHYHYWKNGKLKDDASWLMGQRHGKWIKYDSQGTPLIVISYRNGVELKYDGYSLEP